jgi:hypothetical protein
VVHGAAQGSFFFYLDAKKKAKKVPTGTRGPHSTIGKKIREKKMK